MSVRHEASFVRQAGFRARLTQQIRSRPPFANVIDAWAGDAAPDLTRYSLLEGAVFPDQRFPMFRFRFRLVIALLFAAMLTSPLSAADYHVDPGAAQVSADGSAARPWPNLDAAFESGAVAGGDRILLAPGEYGNTRISRMDFDPPLTLLADPEAPAHFDSLTLDRVSGLVVDGIAIWPRSGVSTPSAALVEETGAGNLLRNLDIRGRRDAADYHAWNTEDWTSTKKVGVRLRGTGSAVTASRLTGIGEGIATLGDGARIEGNVIRGFSADAIRAVGHESLVRNNWIADCVAIDGNHDDGIQSWSRGPEGRAGKGTIRGLVIDANTILEWTGEAGHPLRCPLQGIGMFDGFYRDMVISNNVISVSAYHGIMVSGGDNVRIVNNTLLNAEGPSPKRPWIGIGAHKDGRPSRDSVVANNVAPKYRITGSATSNNLVLPYPASEMELSGPKAFRPRSGSRLVGAGDPARAAPTDRTGRQRDLSDGVDLGAFEIR